MTEKVKLDSVGIYQIRPECVDWGSKSAHPAIDELSHYLAFLVTQSPELMPGPTSEVYEEIDETTASMYANETNRVLRLTANLSDGPVEFDVVIQLAARTSFTYSESQEG